jgi:DHA1 family inner membrane transport protein
MKVSHACESPTLASTLNIAAFNLGNALGAWLGGRLIDAQLPLHFVPLGAAAMALVAIAIAGFSIALEWRGQRADQPAERADQSLCAR